MYLWARLDLHGPSFIFIAFPNKNCETKKVGEKEGMKKENVGEGLEKQEGEVGTFYPRHAWSFLQEEREERGVGKHR